MKIGDTAEDFGSKSSGYTDDVVVYPRPFSDEEIATLVCRGPVAERLLISYKFNNGAEDSSGNANHARRKGSAAKVWENNSVLLSEHRIGLKEKL